MPNNGEVLEQIRSLPGYQALVVAEARAVAELEPGISKAECRLMGELSILDALKEIIEVDLRSSLYDDTTATAEIVNGAVAGQDSTYCAKCGVRNCRPHRVEREARV